MWPLWQALIHRRLKAPPPVRDGGDVLHEEGAMTVIEEIETRIAAANERYGPFASTHEALGVASEEWDELRDAVRANKLGSVDWECLDLAAVLIRLARGIRQQEQQLMKRSVK
jgi:NTP pyrophosphatase (non-canonical NTP hydrolase)